jgi:hypothetical protein
MQPESPPPTLARRAWASLGLNRPRRAAAAVVILVVIGGLGVLSLAGNSNPNGLADLPSATPGTSSGADASPVAGPQVPPVDACDLLTVAELDEAMGLLDLPMSDRNFLMTGGGEACLWRNDRDGGLMEGLSIRVAPGSPDDFAPGAMLEGVSGRPVAGLGAAAVWFGGDGSGVVSVAERSTFGYVFVRLTVERQDLDDAGRLDVAQQLASSALHRLPGVAPWELVTTVLVPELPDRSHVGFVDNLLAREASGAWTRGEGLLATLELLVGEAEAADVLNETDLESHEITGLLRMAADYLEGDGDDDVKPAIEALLGRLVFSHEQLDAMAGLSATADGNGGVATGIVLAAAQRPEARDATMSADAALDCRQFFYDFIPSEGVGPCLEWRKDNIPPGLDADKYRVFVPAPGYPQGPWVEMDYDVILNSLEHSAAILEGLGEMPPVDLVFAVEDYEDALAFATSQGGGKPCGVFVFPALRALELRNRQQSIAHELAHCFTAHNFTPQSRVPYQVTKWWVEGVAEYLSNVVYETNNYEWRWRFNLADLEPATSHLDRDYQNYALFQYVASKGGNDAVFELLRSLPGCGQPRTDLTDEQRAECGTGTVAEQAQGLAAALDRDRNHEFVEQMTDASVRDTGGLTLEYAPQADLIVGVGGTSSLLDAFEMARFHVLVPDGLHACLDYELAGGVTASWRTGAPDGRGTPRDWLRELPRSLSGEGVVAATTTNDGASFTIEVRDYVDSPNDCDRSVPLDGCLEQLICGPSDYFKSPDQLADWLLRVLPPLNL